MVSARIYKYGAQMKLNVSIHIVDRSNILVFWMCELECVRQGNFEAELDECTLQAEHQRKELTQEGGMKHVLLLCDNSLGYPLGTL